VSRDNIRLQEGKEELLSSVNLSPKGLDCLGLERFPALYTSLRYAHCSDTTTLTFCTLCLIQNTTNQVT
jgi:hypothetical protein